MNQPYPPRATAVGPDHAAIENAENRVRVRELEVEVAALKKGKTMTLRESLTEHYVRSPERMASVRVNDCITTDWDAEVRAGDVIEVDWGEHRGTSKWTVPEEINP